MLVVKKKRIINIRTKLSAAVMYDLGAGYNEPIKKQFTAPSYVASEIWQVDIEYRLKWIN